MILHNIPLYNSEGEPELVYIDVDYSDNGFKVIVNACTVITEMKSIPSDEIVDIQTGIARALNYLDEDENPELWRVVVECEIDHKVNSKMAEVVDAEIDGALLR
jgi:proline racemase